MNESLTPPTTGKGKTVILVQHTTETEVRIDPNRGVVEKTRIVATPEDLALAIAEGRGGGRLKHFPFVEGADVFTTGADERGLFVKFEVRYIEGQNLTLTGDVVQLIEVGVDIAAKLIQVHEEGLVLGDVKPANIRIVRTTGERIIIDLATSVLTGERLLEGTHEYLAPEAWQGLPVDGRADVYSLGSMLYEAFVGKTPNEVLWEITANTGDKFTKIEARLRAGCGDSRLCGVILKSIQLDRDLRSNMRELSQSLDALLPSGVIVEMVGGTREIFRASTPEDIGLLLGRITRRDATGLFDMIKRVENPPSVLWTVNGKKLTLGERSGVFLKTLRQAVYGIPLDEIKKIHPDIGYIGNLVKDPTTREAAKFVLYLEDIISRFTSDPEEITLTLVFILKGYNKGSIDAFLNQFQMDCFRRQAEEFGMLRDMKNKVRTTLERVTDEMEKMI